MVDPPRHPDAFTVLVLPTHVGESLRGGRRSIAARLARQHDASVVLMTEIGRAIPRARLAAAFPWLGWVRCGTRPPVIAPRRGSGTIALARRRRFRRLRTSSNRLVSRDTGLKWWPERRCTILDVHDKLTGDDRRFIPLHPWALGRNVEPRIRAGHMEQVKTYGEATRRGRALLRSVILGGDTNEGGNGSGSSPIEKELAAAGARNARPPGDKGHRIVEAFVTPAYRVDSYRLLSEEEAGGDHVAIVLTVTPR